MIDANGQQYQLGTASFTVQSTGLLQELDSVKKISFKVRAPKKATNNSQGKIDGFTIDKMEIEASLAMKLSEWFLLVDALLAANPGRGIGQCQFELSISFGQTVGSMRTATLQSCMLNEDPRDLDENQEAAVVELPLFVMRVAQKDANGNDLNDFIVYQ